MEIRPIEFGNCLFSGTVVTHFYKCESFRPPCLAIHDELHRIDCPDLCKHLGQIGLRNLKSTAVKKTVSGFLKLLHPDGEYKKEDLLVYLELAMESRRRVKEQLKKRGSFEFTLTAITI